jgi:hypothetical protein
MSSPSNALKEPNAMHDHTREARAYLADLQKAAERAKYAGLKPPFVSTGCFQILCAAEAGEDVDPHAFVAATHKVGEARYAAATALLAAGEALEDEAAT